MRYLLVPVVLFSILLAGCDAEPKTLQPVENPASVLSSSSPAPARQADFREIVKSAKDKVFPAVIFIKCLQESMEMGKKVTQEIVGSGVIISPEGEALTNWHVIDKAVEIRCLLYDGTAYDAEVVGSDKDTDLALIRFIRPEGDDKPLRHAGLGRSETLNEGDFVMAMGAPWGLNRSVSIGIVSCTKRYLPESSEYSHWLQTDAAISPGNSGGPLVDTRGKIVGINTRGVSYGGDMGFAIPSDTIGVIVEQLREFNQVNWSWTGLQLQPLKDFRKDIYFEGDRGVIIAETDPDSPARQAGVKMRDRLLAVNGVDINGKWEEDLPNVRRRLGMLPKGQPAELLIERGGETLSLSLTPREKGDVEGEELDCPRWDMTVKAINQFDNPDLYFYHKEGVFIYGIKYPGNAANSSLREQDIILKIGDKEIATLQDVKEAYDKAVENIEKKHRIVFVIERNGLRRQAVLDFSRDYEKE